VFTTSFDASLSELFNTAHSLQSVPVVG